MENIKKETVPQSKPAEPAVKCIGYVYKNGRYITDDGLAFDTAGKAENYCSKINKTKKK